MAIKGECLSIWMHGRLIASLSTQRDKLTLTYSEEAQDTFEVNTPLISVSLPVYPGTYRHERVRPFFEGLLPEGEARRMLAYDFRLAEDDTFGLLKALGRECAGALVIIPAGETPPDQSIREAAPL